MVSVARLRGSDRGGCSGGARSFSAPSGPPPFTLEGKARGRERGGEQEEEKGRGVERESESYMVRPRSKCDRSKHSLTQG